jgi:hypothetical protein
MTLKLTTDHGQVLAPPSGKVIGFIDDEQHFATLTQSLQAAGYADSAVTLLHGQEGIQLLERMWKHNFFFGDSEDEVIAQSRKELARGHYAIAVDVNDHDQAAQISTLAEPLGGRSFRYFGTWVNEQLTR